MPSSFKNYTGAELRTAPAAPDALSFLRVVGKLKELKRTGWVHRGVDKPEYVSCVTSLGDIDPVESRFSSHY